MNKRRIYYCLIVVDMIILLTIVFYKSMSILHYLGIVALLFTLILGLVIPTKEDKYWDLKLGRKKLSIVGIESLFFGLYGFYSLSDLEISTTIGLLYYILMFIVMISNFRLRIHSNGTVYKSEMP